MTTTDELEDEIATAVHLALLRQADGCRCGERGRLDCTHVAEAIVALPEIVELLADAERVRRVRGLADRLDRGSWRDSTTYAEAIRHTLDGGDQ